MNIADIIKKDTVTTWQQIIAWYASLSHSPDHWVFRGCADDSWKLQSTLERAAERLGINMDELPEREGGLLRRFKRHFHQYESQPPYEGDVIEWLSLMQHFGAPTRLLDFSHSFYVALYFALEDRLREPALPVVWAVNQTKLDAMFEFQHGDIHAAYKQRNSRSWEAFIAAFMRNPPVRSVETINPYRLNQRLIIQQGLFLFPLDLKSTFEENVFGLFGNEIDETMIRQLVINFDRPAYKQALIHLHRMNMNRASLFPGLEGFARSLNTLLAFEKEVMPADIEYRESLDASRFTGLENIL